MVTPVILDRQTSVAPLGLRFWDAATNSFISDELSVTAIPKISGKYLGQPITAFSNKSNVFVFHHLPGLRDAENGLGDSDYWSPPPAQKDFTVTVADALGRFLPFTFDVKSPAKGILDFACAGGKPSPDLPLQPDRMVPLFSSSQRVVSGGLASVRASIVKADGSPAAFAMLELYSENKIVGRGVSDARGQVAVFFPYPKFVTPPMTERLALAKQKWTLEIKLFFSLSPPYPVIPDLCAVVSQTAASPPPRESLAPLKKMQFVELKFGEELILKTKDKSELVLS